MPWPWSQSKGQGGRAASPFGLPISSASIAEDSPFVSVLSAPTSWGPRNEPTRSTSSLSHTRAPPSSHSAPARSSSALGLRQYPQNSLSRSDSTNYIESVASSSSTTPTISTTRGKGRAGLGQHQELRINGRSTSPAPSPTSALRIESENSSASAALPPSVPRRREPSPSLQIRRDASIRRSGGKAPLVAFQQNSPYSPILGLSRTSEDSSISIPSIDVNNYATVGRGVSDNSDIANGESSGHSRISLGVTSMLDIPRAARVGANGREFSPTPSTQSFTPSIDSSVARSVTRSQKVSFPANLRSCEENGDSEDSMDQVHATSSSVRRNGLVSPTPSASSAVSGMRGGSRPRENYLENEVARLTKLCDTLQDPPRGAPAVTIPVRRASKNTRRDSSQNNTEIASEGHRVAQIIQKQNEHLQKKLDFQERLVAELMQELTDIQASHSAELQEIHDASQADMQCLVARNEAALCETIAANMRQMDNMKTRLSKQTGVDQEKLDRADAMEAEIAELESRETTLLRNYDTLLDELRQKSAADLAAIKKKLEETEREAEEKRDQMREELEMERQRMKLEYGNKRKSGHYGSIESLKALHEEEVNALKTSIKILHGSRGITVHEIEEQKALFNKVSDLEASLALKVRALTTERKNSEKLRASLIAAEQAKVDEEQAKELAEDMLLSERLKHADVIRETNTKHDEEKNRAIQEQQELHDERHEELNKDRADLLHELDNTRSVREREKLELQEIHRADKDQFLALHEKEIQQLETKINAAGAAEYQKLVDQLSNVDAKHAEISRVICEERDAAEMELSAIRNELQKEKELLIAEYQVVIAAGDRIRESDREAHAKEMQSMAASFASLQADHEKDKSMLKDEFDKQLETCREDFASRLAQLGKEKSILIGQFESKLEAQHDEHEQTLQEATLQSNKHMEELKEQLEIQFQTRLEAEQAKTQEAELRMRDVQDVHAQAIRKLVLQHTTEKECAELSSGLFQQQVDDMSQRNESLAVQIEQAKSAHLSTQQELAAVKADHDTLATTKREVENKLESLVAHTATLESKINVMDEATRNFAEEREDELRLLKTNSDNVLRTFAEYKEEKEAQHIAETKRLQSSLDEVVFRASEDSRIAEAKLKEQQILVGKFQAMANKRLEDMTKLEVNMRDANATNHAFSDQIRKMHADSKMSENEAKSHKSEIQGLAQELNRINGENARLQNELSAMRRLEPHAKQANADPVAHKEPVETQAALIRTMEAELQKKQTMLDSLQKGKTVLTNGTSAGPSSKLANGTSPTSDSRLKRDLDESTAEIIRLREKLESYEFEYRDLHDENQRMKTQQAGHAGVVAELEKAKRDMRDMESRVQSAELRLATSGILGAMHGSGVGRSQSSMSYVRPQGRNFDAYDEEEDDDESSTMS